MNRKILLGEALAREALTAINAGLESRGLVAAAKRMVCDDAVWIADKAIQIHGGYGYTTEYLPERWWRDLRLMPIGGGTSEIMAALVAKDLGRQA
jgi:acyl-CoA dehydrogenase